MLRDEREALARKLADAFQQLPFHARVLEEGIGGLRVEVRVPLDRHAKYRPLVAIITLEGDEPGTVTYVVPPYCDGVRSCVARVLEREKT